jgi:hypothetical protein
MIYRKGARNAKKKTPLIPGIFAANGFTKFFLSLQGRVKS